MATENAWRPRDLEPFQTIDAKSLGSNKRATTRCTGSDAPAQREARDRCLDIIGIYHLTLIIQRLILNLIECMFGINNFRIS